MNEQIAVQVHPDTRRSVLQMLQHQGDTRSVGQLVNEVVNAALKDWLAAAAVADPRAAKAANRGYQWKSLFLPEGTLLRVFVGGEYTVATVCGDDIVFQGHSYSPRQFVMLVTGQVRNAWLALWIRCPGDARWHLADTRRHLLRRLRPGSQRVPATPVAPAAPADPVRGHLSDPSAAFRAHLRAACLRRDDIVLDEQPDLSIRLPAGRGAGRFGAGRAGPRDRRAPACFMDAWWGRPSGI